MICRDSNLCGKRKAEESNDENDVATAAKVAIQCLFPV